MTDTVVRPALDSLRELPTLQAVTESVGRLELKLETETNRYWVTTEGVPQKTSGLPVNCVVDYVTVERRTPDGEWDLQAVYSPEAWKLSQGFDYTHLILAERDDLERQLEAEFSWELLQRLEELDAELEQVNRVLTLLARKVRSSGL
jgi:hypothetical protein